MEVTILEIHLRDQMTFSHGSMGILVPFLKSDSFDQKILDLAQPSALLERRSFERTEKNWKAKFNRHTVDPCPRVPKKKLQKIPKID